VLLDAGTDAGSGSLLRRVDKLLRTTDCDHFLIHNFDFKDGKRKESRLIFDISIKM